MQPRDDRALEILRELGSRPAAPFFEEGPAQYILELLGRLPLDTMRDAYGNIIAHYKRRSRAFSGAHSLRGPHGPSRLRDR